MRFFKLVTILCIATLFSSYDISASTIVNGKPVKMIQWEEAKEILPKYSIFTVLDIKTGLSFKVQRRAGSNHADVQPLTSDDTAVMKAIYNGNWSWKRRAIIVIAKDERIAASMHGMPHGGGALKNNFPGHFCIHFYGSTTHRTNFMDLSHKLMILKAAGKLEKYLEETDPYDLVNAYIAGIKQQDPEIISYISLQPLDWVPIFVGIVNIRISKMEILPYEDLTDELTLSVPVEISMQVSGKGSRDFKGQIHLVRFSPNEQWRVDSCLFLKGSGIKD